MNDAQNRMLIRIARSEHTPINGAEPDCPQDTLTWVDEVVRDKIDSGLLLSLHNAGMVSMHGNVVALSHAGFKTYKELRG